MSDRAFERFIVWAILVVALIGALTVPWLGGKMYKGTILVNFPTYEVELVFDCSTVAGVLVQVIDAQEREGWTSMVVTIEKGGKDVV
jgi:hypothetical protein